MLKRIALTGLFVLAFGFTGSGIAQNKSSSTSSDKAATAKKAPSQPQPEGFCYPPGMCH